MSEADKSEQVGLVKHTWARVYGGIDFYPAGHERVRLRFDHPTEVNNLIRDLQQVYREVVRQTEDRP